MNRTVAVVGYGKMGHMIEEIAKNRGFEVITIDPKHPDADYVKLEDAPLDVDAFIDFTAPQVIMDNIKFYCDNKLNAVIGTTGWYEEIPKVKQMVEEAGNGLIYASNFSIGVNMFFKMVENASVIANKFEEYDAAGHEFHHKEKLDSPSGTAKSIAEIMLKNLSRKSKIEYGVVDRKIEADEIHYSSTRVGHIPGTHSVYFDSPADTIELKHTARNREGFASGAVHAGAWITGKKGFFKIGDMMEDMFD